MLSVQLLGSSVSSFTGGCPLALESAKLQNYVTKVQQWWHPTSSSQSSWAFSCDSLCSFREFCSSTAPDALMLLPPPTTSESDSLGFRSVLTGPLCRASICKHYSGTAGSLSRWAGNSQPFFWRPLAGFGYQLPWRGSQREQSLGISGEKGIEHTGKK